MFNNVSFVGRLVKDNQVKAYNTQHGQGYVLKQTIAVATSEKDGTAFIDFTAWNKQAEYLAKYSKKGTIVAIAGEMRQEHWQDQQGQNRSKLSVFVKNIKIIADGVYPNENQQQGQYQGAVDSLGYPINNNQAQYQQPPQSIRQQAQTNGVSLGEQAQMNFQANNQMRQAQQAPQQEYVSDSEIPF